MARVQDMCAPPGPVAVNRKSLIPIEFHADAISAVLVATKVSIGAAQLQVTAGSDEALPNEVPLRNHSKVPKLVSHCVFKVSNVIESGGAMGEGPRGSSATSGPLVSVLGYASIELRDKSNVFNTDLTEALELKSMIDVASALAVSAYQRTESRGSHQRLDYTERDDEKFLKHSLATYTAQGEPRIDYCDVVITRSQPGERVYGGKQE